MNEIREQLAGLTIDHVAIAVADLEEATGPYRLLGFSEGEDEIVAAQGVRVRMLEVATDVTDEAIAGREDAEDRIGPKMDRVELLEPTAPDTPVGRFLERRGPGLHHLGLRVQSLDSAVERLLRAGAEFTGAPRPGHGGTRVVFLHPRWANGVLLELVERPALADD